MDSDKKVSTSDPIQNTTGEFGRWQLWLCILLCMTRIPAAWHHISIVFLAPPVHFFCNDSGVSALDDPCLTFDQNTTTVIKCSSWSYDRSIFKETIISQWDLVCDRQPLATLAQSALMLGNVFGDVLFGMAADRFGRKCPLLVAVVMVVLCGTASALVPWLEVYLVLRFFTALAVGGTMVTSFVLCMESVGGKWRMVVANLYHIPYGLGYSSMGLIAYFLRDWKIFQIAISIPCTCFIAYFWLIPESARWLVTAGKYDQAMKVLNMAIKVNKLQKPPGDLVERLKEMNGTSNKQEKMSTATLLRTRQLRMRTFCMCYNWFVSGFCFFGLAQFMGKFGGNIFLNVGLAGLLLLPGKFVGMMTLDRYGRRATLISSLLLTGLGSILVAAVTIVELEWLKTVFALCGIIGLSVSIPTVYLYSIELFPTVIRNNGLGFTSMCGRIGSVVAPVAVSLSEVSIYLPPLLFGVVPLVGIAFTWQLPETAHTRLPHSIEDVENPRRNEPLSKNGVINQGCELEATDL